MNYEVRRRSRLRSYFGDPASWILSGIAIAAAYYISRQPAFEHISAVVSDEISRGLGATSNGPVVLVRLDRDLSRADLQKLLTKAIPALVDNYGAAALGIDIDFSGSEYADLGKSFAAWSARQPESSQKIVWANGFERGVASPGGGAPLQACESCSGTACTSRFRPKPFFGGQFTPANYGIAYAATDESGVSRYSLRFVCHADTTARLDVFHFKLAETYCRAHPDEYTCKNQAPNRQSVTRLHSWYDAEVLDLCKLVSCEANALGRVPSNIPPVLRNRIAVLYSDLEGNDEHATIAGTRKGADVVASLAMNELLYGASDERLLEGLKIALEIALTVLLIFLFHWPRTRDWAVLLSGAIFVGYLYFVRRLSIAIPDLRDYALAAMLALAIEVWVKAAWQSLTRAEHES